MTGTENRSLQDAKEQRRRRRERIIIIATIVLILILTFIETHLSKIESLIPISNNVLIFALININIILVILLIFLIVRNVVKLVSERKHGILGSKLRTKLVAAFVGLSLIPTAILFFVAINLLSYSIDNWFSMKVGGALNLSLDIAQAYYQQYSDNARFYARQIGSVITANRLYQSERSPYLQTYADQRQKDLKVSMLEISFKNNPEKFVFRGAEEADLQPKKPAPELIDEVFAGKDVSTTQSLGQGDLIIGLAPVLSPLEQNEVIGIVAVYYYIPKSVIDKVSVISKTSEEYRQFRLLKNPIKLSYIITLFIITLLIIFSATWFGIYLAKGITVPIQDLAQATRKIAQGNLDYQIDIVSDDEIGVLVDSFNQMTRDLKISHEEVQQANIDLERRRKYMETVLRNVSAGVVSIDMDGNITTINRASERMLGIKTDKVLGRKFREVLKPEHLVLVEEFLKEITESETGFIEKQIELNLPDRTLTVWITTTILRDEEGNYMGMVVVFEDLTALQKAERMAAWREVARRIAHEIKNPLTPVQLSAQRLQKKYGDKLEEDGGVFYECTKTIIDQVEVLKRLVNEFSLYARMPVAQPAPNHINEVIAGTVNLFQDAHKEIEFVFSMAEDIPAVNIDSEQIKRVMMNLLDNAAAAVQKDEGRVEIRTSFDKISMMAKVDVIDNGTGIAPRDKMRMFEPYFSTKKAGTGLGLAIVSSIISDHRGTISVKDNRPKGTIVTFELPAA
ncbi:MAG: ATP-binding protein [Syntrophales bacterium]